jgi:hypothetical protein
MQQRIFKTLTTTISLTEYLHLFIKTFPLKLSASSRSCIEGWNLAAFIDSIYPQTPRTVLHTKHHKHHYQVEKPRIALPKIKKEGKNREKN